MKWTLNLVGHAEIVGECDSYDDAMKQACENCNVGVWALLGRYDDEDVDYTEYMGFLYDITKEKKPYPNRYLGSLIIDNDGIDGNIEDATKEQMWTELTLQSIDLAKTMTDRDNRETMDFTSALPILDRLLDVYIHIKKVKP